MCVLYIQSYILIYIYIHTLTFEYETKVDGRLQHYTNYVDNWLFLNISVMLCVCGGCCCGCGCGCGCVCVYFHSGALFLQGGAAAWPAVLLRWPGAGFARCAGRTIDTMCSIQLTTKLVLGHAVLKCKAMKSNLHLYCCLTCVQAVSVKVATIQTLIFV